jgi:vacuolar-type H+-ATPase subunit C/Vma6
MEQELGLFLDHLATTRYERHIVSEGLMMWPEDRSFWRLEIACDNFILQRFWEMRMHLFSIAPLIYYLLRKIAETKLIQAVMRCKLAGMSQSETTERLRTAYV